VCLHISLLTIYYDRVDSSFTGPKEEPRGCHLAYYFKNIVNEFSCRRGWQEHKWSRIQQRSWCFAAFPAYIQVSNSKRASWNEETG
jgi:hypothetical protein